MQQDETENRISGYPVVLTSEHGQTAGIYADGQVRSFSVSASALLEQWCLANGSSMKGRMESFRFLTGTSRKAGVLINEISGPLYFPVYGMTSARSVWISRMDLKRFAADGGRTRLFFFRGLTFEADCGYRVIQNQMIRCDAFLKALEKPSCSLAAKELPAFVKAEIS